MDTVMDEPPWVREQIPDEGNAVAPKELPAQPDRDITVSDFWAYLPMHSYIFAPTGEMWPGASVNSRVPAVQANGKALKPAQWLDSERAVEQMTWAPGEPLIIEGKLIANGGWIYHSDCRCFNLYRAPVLARGDRSQAQPWIDHVHRLYGAEAPHIIRWLAHRVQHPGEKINHALVLGGKQGIGKDTLLEPVKYAIGPWNFSEVAPTHLLGRFNSFVKSVILRVSEARDLGDVDRYGFYDHMKTYTASPPDVLRCDEKNVREYAVPNVCGVIITTNHKGDGIYLPADDRRHFVAWSDLDRSDFEPEYWPKLYGWFGRGGNAHVAAYLTQLDLSGFDPKAPPPQTAAFWDIVDANRSPEDAELADVLDGIGRPPAITLARLADRAEAAFKDWLQDRKNRRQVPHRLEGAGYVPVRNSNADDGLWVVSGRRQTIYAHATLALRDRIAAAVELSGVQRDKLLG